jgi:hypothetical protein
MGVDLGDQGLSLLLDAFDGDGVGNPAVAV